MSDVQIQIADNGPYRVRGDIELTDHEGNVIETPGAVIALCRCGGSTNKPFCDGTHSQIGFQGAIKAVEDSAS